MFDFDVAVVGAGPAGATVARELAATGASVALLERARLPRYKSCAGGIPVRTAALLPFSLDAVVEDRISALNVSYHGASRFTRRSGSPFALMVMRDRFDDLLTRRAVDSGAELCEEFAVSDVQPHRGGFDLRAGKRSVSARFVVGADGANSVVARKLALGAGMAESVALEAEVCARDDELTRWRGMLNVDFGYRPWGYGWVFPKERRLSIGLVLPRDAGGQIRRHLQVYLARLGLDTAEVERIVGHKLLFRRGSERIAAPGVALVGDAAGLADEFTEEGIYYAVRSGQLASRVIARALEDGFASLGAYQRMVDRRIMPELRAARIIAWLFYGMLRRSPSVMLALSRRLNYFWDAFFRIQQGESSYDQELRRAWLLRAAMPLVDRASLG
jgi:geranylgeranyl reductase family protein